MPPVLHVKLLSVKCHRVLLILCQRWSGNGLVPSGNKPLPEPMLTQFLVSPYVATSHNELIHYISSHSKTLGTVHNKISNHASCWTFEGCLEISWTVYHRGDLKYAEPWGVTSNFTFSLPAFLGTDSLGWNHFLSNQSSLSLSPLIGFSPLELWRQHQTLPGQLLFFQGARWWGNPWLNITLRLWSGWPWKFIMAAVYLGYRYSPTSRLFYSLLAQP